MGGGFKIGDDNVISSVTVKGEQLKKIAEILKINNPKVQSAKIDFIGDKGSGGKHK